MAESPRWHEDTEFLEAFREFVFPPGKVEEAVEQVEQLLPVLGLESNAKVLDIPCGIGRHAVELAVRGYHVTAVDVTDPFLETARDRAQDADVDIEFLQADMREFQRPESFDAILNLYTSFGYFEERDDDEQTARNFYTSLKPGGTLVMSLTSKEILARKFEERTWGELDGTYILEEHHITDNWNWIENRWIMITDGDVKEFSVSHRLYSAFELSELLERVGFSDVTVYGSLDGADYDEIAERLVLVAQK